MNPVGNYDVIIIGAGHNGLVTAGMLAKDGDNKDVPADDRQETGETR